MPSQRDEVDSASVAYFAEPSLAPIVLHRRPIISVADVSQGICGHGGFRLGAVVHILGLRVGVRMRSGSVALGLLDDSKWKISVLFCCSGFVQMLLPLMRFSLCFVERTSLPTDQSSSEILLTFAESWMLYVGERLRLYVPRWSVSLTKCTHPCLEDAVRVATDKQADW